MVRIIPVVPKVVVYGIVTRGPAFSMFQMVLLCSRIGLLTAFLKMIRPCTKGLETISLAHLFATLAIWTKKKRILSCLPTACLVEVNVFGTKTAPSTMRNKIFP